MDRRRLKQISQQSIQYFSRCFGLEQSCGPTKESFIHWATAHVYSAQDFQNTGSVAIILNSFCLYGVEDEES